MSAWTPAQREYAHAAEGSSRAAAAISLIAVGIAFAAAALFEVTQPDEPAWIAAFALALGAIFGGAGMALAFRRGETAEALAETPEVPQAGIVLTGSISSDVVLDYDRGTATKVYRPTKPVRLLYALSFQSAFPYTTNEAAFTAAAERRAIAGLLTEYWFGENHVSPVLDVVRWHDGRFSLITELVRGTSPRNPKRARAFLNELQARFEDAGLPPWQVASYNPRAIGNLIERTDGAYRIIDLESNLVSPFLRPRVLWRALRAGLYPSFDEINVERINRYIERNLGDIEAILGEEKANSLRISAANYGVAQRAWHASERRYVSKTLRFFAAIIDVPGWFRGARRLANGGERMATDIASAGIDNWVAEGLMQPAEAAVARDSLAAPEMTAATAGLGAHLAMSVPLRFPLGSIARSGWTVAARAKGEWSGIRNPTARREARAVHSAPVAILGAVPGFGAFAYLAAAPFRKQRALRAVLFDQALRHMPFRLHARLHLGSLSRWMALPATGQGITRPGLRAALSATAVVAGAAAIGATAAGLLSGHVLERVAFSGLALAGAAALLAFRSFWKTGSSASIAEQAGSFLWLIAGIGAMGAGIDLGLGVSANVAGAFEDVNLPLIPGESETAMLAAASYGLTVASTAWFFRHEFFAGRASSLTFAAATVAAGGAFALQATAVNGGSALAAFAAVTLAGASLLRVRETSSARTHGAGARSNPFVLAANRLESTAARFAAMPLLTARLLVFTAAFAGLALAGSAAIDPHSAEPDLFRDFGPVTFLSSALMLVAGTMGISAWRKDGERAIYRDLWGAWGLAFAILAFDATPDIHGKLGGLVSAATPFDHPFGFHRPSDFIVAVYGLSGLAISAVLWKQVFEHPKAILYFFGAAPFAVLTVAIDGFAAHAWTITLVEEGAELMALAFFVGGFAQRYRESAQANSAASQVIDLAPLLLQTAA